ncbi:MAG: substrate-binding domain-containing protein [Acidobacteria bacterium]|nr:substrate-binding domain-containing protein [Acidobacteriota bacterium]
MRISKFTKVAIMATVAAVAVVPSAVAYDLTGAGATSVTNFLEKCKTSYQNDTKDTFSYASGGSGAGKTAINAGTKDVAFSDSANTNADKPASVFHIPAAVWPIGIAYNLNNSANKPLQLSVGTIAKIFAGQITMWNDPAIVADAQRVREIPVYEVKDGKTVLDANGSPVIKSYRKLTIPFTMPAKPITVIYRGGTSGTTNNFVSALAGLAPTVWTKPATDAFTTSNPLDVSTRPGTFQAGTGSNGVADIAGRTKYSIAYVETGFISANPALKAAVVLNNAGKSVSPNVAGAQGMFAASDLNEATGLVKWNYATTSPAAYPFTAATYAMVKSNYGKADLAAAVKRQVEYMAFNCSKSVTTEGMIPIEKTSDLGKAILKLTAKIG